MIENPGSVKMCDGVDLRNVGYSEPLYHAPADCYIEWPQDIESNAGGAYLCDRCWSFAKRVLPSITVSRLV